MVPQLRRVLGSSFVRTLATPHHVDRYLELFEPTWSLDEVRARVVAKRLDTADSVTLTLRPNRNWKGFAPGQFVRLTIEIDGVQRTRCYSPANSAHVTGEIELTAKAHKDGFVSRYLREKLQVGEVVTLSQADGAFRLPEQRPHRILLISGGSGITPVMSMLRTLCQEGYSGRITFLHYAFTAQDLIYHAELRELAARDSNVELIRAYTAQDQGGELHGLFSRAQLAAAVPDYGQAQTFLCGPPGLMKAVQSVWEADGIATRLHLEHFTAAALPAPASDSVEGEVRFVRSERFAANTGASLLDQAESAGLKPQSGCRMGICHSCTCRMKSGTVRDLRDGRITSGDEDIQICVSVPVGSVTLDI